MNINQRTIGIQKSYIISTVKYGNVSININDGYS